MAARRNLAAVVECDVHVCGRGVAVNVRLVRIWVKTDQPERIGMSQCPPHYRKDEYTD
jgi:hypothetical protein